MEVEAIFAGVNGESAAIDALNGHCVYGSNRALYHYSSGMVKCLYPLVHADQIHSVRLVGTLLLACSADGVLSLWRMNEAFELLNSYKHDCALIRVDAGFALDAQGSLLQFDDDLCLKKRVSVGGKLLALAVDPTGELVAVSTSDCMIKVYDAVDLRYLGDLSGHTDWIGWLSWSPDGQRLVSCSMDRTARVWCCTTQAEESKGLRELVERKGQFEGLSCESILEGHDGAVHRACFDGTCLYTSSADHSIIAWSTSSWTSTKQMAISGGEDPYGLLSVCCLHCNTIIGHCASGSICKWTDGVEGMLLSGHVGSVEDVAFTNEDVVLLSVSTDQTTRAWKHNSKWEEVARPQVHGYDMRCITCLPDGRFVSAGEEKVMRVFEPGAGGIQPSLGLSNKGNKAAFEWPTEGCLEAQLQRATLWPELDKLYGHVHELYCVAASADGQWLASAAKANQAQDAAIRLWQVGSVISPVAVLPAHSLTVCRLRWSPNSNYLLAVSRDRSFSIHHHDKLVVLREGHARIIWDAAWLDANHFVTCSRDRTVKLWLFTNDSVELIQTHEHGEPLTACAYSNGRLALGTEQGNLLFLDCNLQLVQQMNAVAAGQIKSMAWSANGTRLAVASADHSLRILK